jgi:FtsP/CotA-like multicopper oxidase with cupredoxin domain
MPTQELERLHPRRAAARRFPSVRLVLAAAAVLAAARAGALPVPRTGLVCTTGAAANPTFVLTAQAGNIALPDGNTMYMWSFAPAGGPFQHPGPVLCVQQGDTVTIVLRNDLPEDVSIVFPGQEGVLANGAPAGPQLQGGVLTSLTATAPAGGGSAVYRFVATSPGTFLYESGTDPAKQVRMGLFGALVVRPARGPAFMFDRTDSRFTPGEEFLVLLSEIDPYQHWAVEAGLPFDLNGYHPRYWLLNGRGFPDTIADNGAPFLPEQPYGALARVHPWDPLAHPQGGAIRYLNVGTEEYPLHPHGNNGLVIGRDGRALEGPAGEDLSFEKFSFDIGPGQTWDVTFRYYDAEGYDASSNPVPVTVPELANQTIGMMYSGSPYLGEMGAMPPGMSTQNECGEFYVISHNHALFQLTSWGVTMTGPITYLRVDPPPPNGCP